MNREPVRIIGIVASVTIAVITALGQEGVLAEDAVQNLVTLVTIIAPWVAAEVARRLVTPIAAPQNNEGVALVPKTALG